MNLSDESLKTIRATHLLSVGVSAVSVVLLFAPFESDYHDALREAVLLKNVAFRGFDKYAHDAIGVRWANPDFLPHQSDSEPVWAGLHTFINNQVCCISPEEPDYNADGHGWSVTPIIDYDPPPIGKPLQEWLTWINLKVPAHYRNADWTNAFVTYDSREPTKLCAGDPTGPDGESCTPPKWRVLRLFSVRPQNPTISGAVFYRFRAYFDTGMRRKQTSAWWSELEDVPVERLKEPAFRQALERRGSSVVEGLAFATPPIKGVDLTSISNWIKNDPSTRGLFQTGRADDPGIQYLREHWSVLSSKTLDEAIAFMEQEQKHVRDVTILGIAVPGALCIVAIPLAYCVCHLYLLLHLYSCIAVTRTSVEPLAAHFPWIGFYDQPIARLTTGLSLTVVPVVLSALLVFRYNSRLGLASSIPGSVLAVLGLAFGWLAWRSTHLLGERLFGWKKSHGPPASKGTGDAVTGSE